MKDTIYRADAIEEVASADETNGTIKVFSGLEIIDMLKALPSAEPTTEEVWSVAQKVFCSTLTYREAIDYLKEVEKQHERFNQLNRSKANTSREV